MTKKLSIIALMGLSVVLAGCSLPGTQDPQIAAQTQMIQQMQTQIDSLLSGVDALKAQNTALSDMLTKVTSYVDTQTQTQAITTHGAAPLIDPMGINTGIVDTAIMLPDLTGAMTGDIAVNTGIVTDTGSIQTLSGSQNNSGINSILDALKKASEASKLKAKTGTIVQIPMQAVK